MAKVSDFLRTAWHWTIDQFFSISDFHIETRDNDEDGSGGKLIRITFASSAGSHQTGWFKLNDALTIIKSFEP